ncbi:acyl carrier protein [Paenibacillus endophyticus]|uniref:Acyl carrier protein n=1 Tax=Paenibacillus endophyticus TaxID=1294268 RepID=A0A7W5GBU8_9BACL|nr:acyl carrier protein [Paenibacillus endophyticus]MBB3154210.1 acyl carrier protein [Paenibacillus endophyticus]
MFDKIKEILAKVKEDENLTDSLQPNSDLINEVGLDSLQMIGFILEVEETFLVEIDYENFDLKHLNSIETFMSFLNRLEPQHG